MTALVVIDRAPYGDWRGREAVDMGFSLAAFDQPVSFLFTGPGVNWLRMGQDATELSQKNLARQLGAAAIFGVEALLVDHKALAAYQLSVDTLSSPAQPVTVSPGLYGQYDHILCL
ncbi:MAG: DsrE family protein [Oleiphilaceae bacterium]|nr:DsrE family protein [Oleiphilaceae bacterium]